MLDALPIILVQAAETSGTPAGDLLSEIDWPSLLREGGQVPLIVWLIYEVFDLRKENSKLNQEARDMAKSAVDALSRMAQERRS